jgi:hypothetical protein
MSVIGAKGERSPLPVVRPDLPTLEIVTAWTKVRRDQIGEAVGKVVELHARPASIGQVLGQHLPAAREQGDRIILGHGIPKSVIPQ